MYLVGLYIYNREEVCKSKVLRRKFVPEKKEVTEVIISAIEFRTSPSDGDEGWKERGRVHN